MRNLILLLALVVTGCASSSGIGNKLDALVGEQKQVVINTLGYPTRTFKAPNGRDVFQYTQTRQYERASTTIYQQNLGTSSTYGGGTATSTCSVFFEFWPSGRVFKWTSQGNGCNL
ncbi:hypothetical protein [uncultured Marinobacter sp.]|uniref:hypothetical protein n=1 Tax=uncultured Marinobacter sp. TaxID=187379 RepID=UPI0025983CEE|nr:hypothetical protein [uncultured Marinobacter sp.]